MKILVISDTHGNFAEIRKVLSRENDADAIIHCGDIEGDEQNLKKLAGNRILKMVSGNCDFFTLLKSDECFTLCGHTFFLTHGHQYGISMGCEYLLEEGISRGADMVLFGHTHRPTLIQHKDIMALNPGSLSYPRQENRIPSYAVITIDDKGRIIPEIRYM